MNTQTCCFEAFCKSSLLQTSIPPSLPIATAAGFYSKEHAESFPFVFPHNFMLASYLGSFSCAESVSSERETKN